MNPVPNTRADNVRLAVGAILASVFALSVGDAIIKYISVSLSLWQIYVLRSLLALAVLCGGFSRARRAWRPQSIRWTLLRSLLLGVMWVAYFTALPHIELSVAAAVYYTSPLFVTLFSARLSGDRVGLKTWLAVLLGFVGVVAMVKPDAEGFNAYALLPLVAAVLYALAMSLTRSHCRHENPITLALWLNLTFIVLGAVASVGLLLWSPSTALVEQNPFLLGGWKPLDAKAAAAIGVLAGAILIGSLMAAVAYQNAPSATVATFDYAYLVFSVMWGIIVFAEIPDALGVLGMLMVVGAGVVVLRQ